MTETTTVRIALKWAALVVAGLTLLVCGMVYLFSAFQNPLKATYNYTQTEAAALASLSNLGVGMAFIPGMLYDKYGPTLTSILGLIISTGGYLLIWSTTRSVAFYKDKSWLTGIYFLMGGNGSTFQYIASLYTAIRIAPERYRGTVCGMMNCCFSMGPVIFAFVYYQFFIHGPQSIDSNHDFPGFMMMNAVSFGTVGLLCIILLRNYEPQSVNGEFAEVSDLKEPSTSILSKQGSYKLEKSEYVYSIDVSVESLDDSLRSTKNTNAIEKSSIPEKEPESSCPVIQQKTFLELMRDVDFQLFMWMFGISSAVGVVYYNNITTTTKSMALTEYDTAAVIMSPSVNFVTSLFLGIISDRLKRRVRRSYYILFGNIAYVACGVVYIIRGDQIIVFMIATALSSIGMCVSWSVIPAYLSELYGTIYFGRNWGILMILSAIIAIAQQEIFAALYDSRIDIEGTVICYGFECIQGSFGAMLAFSVLGLVLNIIHFVRETRQIKQGG